MNEHEAESGTPDVSPIFSHKPELLFPSVCLRYIRMPLTIISVLADGFMCMRSVSLCLRYVNVSGAGIVCLAAVGLCKTPYIFIVFATTQKRIVFEEYMKHDSQFPH